MLWPIWGREAAQPCHGRFGGGRLPDHAKADLGEGGSPTMAWPRLPNHAMADLGEGGCPTMLWPIWGREAARPWHGPICGSAL